MKKTSTSPMPSKLWPGILSVVIWAALGLIFFGGTYKLLTLCAGVMLVVLLFTGRVQNLFSPSAILLLIYLVFSGLTAFWAMSGKFFLQEYSKIFVAGCLFVAVLVCRRFEKGTLSRLMGIIAGLSALIAALSVEAASTGLSQSLLHLIPGMSSVSMGFEEGTRLTGILGNANISASILALGIFYSLSLMGSSQQTKQRGVYAALLSLNAFAFLLSFSMGAMACFAVAVVLYLVFSGKAWISVLIRMLAAALPTLVFAFAAFPFFNREGVVVVIPVIAMVCNVAVVVLLDRFVSPRLVAALEDRRKLALGVLAGVVVLAAAYVVLGYNLSGPYTFAQDALNRSAYPDPGAHTLSIQATGEVQVTVTSQNMSQVMMHTNTVLYQGSAQDASFTVPEDSKVCYFNFTAQPGTVLQEASLDGTEALRLDYTLLPGFIANRLQGLWANQNAIQRTVFFEDGLKMFFQHPIRGNGVGSFETGITSVQDFYYETKYVHNHYIQVLLESGLVGLVAFVGGLCAMAWSLWKRRKDTQWPFAQAYAALWAALAMIVGHAAVEVSMSMIIFVCYAFVTFAMIIRCCGEPTAQEKSVVNPFSRLSKGKLMAVRGACAVLPAVFLISLGCNMLSSYLLSRPITSQQDLFMTLRSAASMDPYEGNDAKLSYVVSVLDSDDEELYQQANIYAQELMQVQSNSIPQVLVQYYLYTNQQEQAIQAAKAGAAYSASNASVWESTLGIFRSVLISGIYSPLMSDIQPLTDGILEYYDLLRDRNQTSMEQISLSLNAQDFLSKMIFLSQSDGTTETVYNTISYQMFSLHHGCDANADGIHDQILTTASATVGDDGSIGLEANGSIVLNLRVIAQPAGEVRVTCENPQALSLVVNSELPLTPASVDGNTAVFLLPLASYTEGSPLTLQLSTSQAQTIQDLTVYALQG